MPTASEIREMEGIDLVYWAHRCSLAPENAMSVWDEGTDEFVGCWLHSEHGEPIALWEPDKNIIQADAVLRKLRALGWEIATTSNAEGGNCRAWPLATNGKGRHMSDSWLESEWCGESLALLRCACLAMASMQEAGG